MNDYKYILEFKDIPFSRNISSDDVIKIKDKLKNFFSEWKSLETEPIIFDENTLRFNLFQANIGRMDQLDGYTIVIPQIGITNEDGNIGQYRPYEGFTKDDMIKAIEEQHDYWKRRGVKY
ncbi:hypothetical protein MODO_3145 [Myroides odoratimimus]|uniref:hypothetical protein n=1 Tax=Myroides odoratimimus TaxID=76832 RepID=UPI000726E8CE|nr:hypothetical protein [Myroides odoratimimus]GAQ15449.1 hypothetical protein MODO_3145 [Myroides odoratimimus]STZ48148.1 Uncharacterised protein [Myroides odoratimimus]